MKRRLAQQPMAAGAFEKVKAAGLSLPDVEATTRYDGAPVLKVRGIFMAGLATHASAESDTLVVRSDFEARQWLLEDAPETYYITDYYRKYPLVLARLSCIDGDALRGLLFVSWRMARAKSPKRGRTRPRAESTSISTVRPRMRRSNRDNLG